MRLHSYVVRYDSGFAPNPFYGFCTLATCKPDIRKFAQVGDWVVGTGSADKKVQLGGFLIYAMKVTEILNRLEYWEDQRFQRKQANLRGSKKHACGDNIYFWNEEEECWSQLDSFHSQKDGTTNKNHLKRDTSVDRILVSDDFVYFGGSGPQIPLELRKCNGDDLCKSGRGRRVFEDSEIVQKSIAWIQSLGMAGFVSAPFDRLRPV